MFEFLELPVDGWHHSHVVVLLLCHGVLHGHVVGDVRKNYSFI